MRIAAIALGISLVIGASFFRWYQPLEYVESKSSETVVNQTVPELTTDVWGVFDPVSGDILIGKNESEVRPIASVVKLFTADAVLSSGKEHVPFMITERDVATEGRAGKLSVGDMVTPYELLFPLLLESSNDAATAIERILGATYKTHIEKTIQAFNLAETEVADSSGLRKETVSSVRDLARLYAHIEKTHPHLFDITELHTYIGKDEGYYNSDPVRSLTQFTGGKQGFTDEAGRTFVGSFELKNGRQIGIILLGSEDLLKDVTELLVYAEAVKK